MNSCVAFFDGGNRNKQSCGAAAAVLYEGDREIVAAAKFFDFLTTNNECEYEGAALALELAIKHGYMKVDIYGDSELVIRQITGQYKARDPRMIAARDRVWSISERLDWVRFLETPKGAKGKRRDNNARADQLCGRAMDLGQNLHYKSERG